MKTKLILIALFAACFVAAAQVTVATKLISDPTGWKIGSHLIVDANKMIVLDTNYVAAVATNVVVPVFVDKAQDILVSLQTILTSVLGIIAAVLTVFAKLKNDQAKVLPVLIRAVEDHNSQPLKEAIQDGANKAGVQSALHAAVQKVTANDKNDDAHPPDITTLPTPPATATDPVKQ